MLQMGLFVAVVASGPTSDAAQAGLLVWALTGPLAALKSLALFIVVRNFNPVLAAHGPLGSVLSWALPLIVSVRLLPLITGQSLRVLVPLWTFCAIAALCSVLTSAAVAVSLMKAATLAIVASGVLIAGQRLTLAESRQLGTWLRTLAVVVTALSLATIVRPGIAHLPNSDLLNGILGHSQALAAFLAPFAAAALAEWMLARGSATPLRTAIWFGILGCTLLTASRTGALAAILGLAFSIAGGATADRKLAGAAVQRAFGMIAALALVLLVVQLATGRVSSGISGFVLKGGQGSVSESFQASRGGLVATQLSNFMSSPWIGHGFGVFAGDDPTPGVRTFMGIPVSAPVEKGVLPTAVLEETGIIGFLCFAWVVYALVAPVWRRARHPIVAMLVAALFVNLGEAILLSPGGMGLHIWLLIAWCIRAAEVESSPSLADNRPTPAPRPRSPPYPNLLD